MNKSFVRQMKKRLEGMKKEILLRLAADNDEFRKITQSEDTADLVDVATGDIDRSLLEALGREELKRLNLIEAALARIEEGRYGICLKTGKPIPDERLEAIPYALYRVEVQDQMDRRRA